MKPVLNLVFLICLMLAVAACSSEQPVSIPAATEAPILTATVAATQPPAPAATVTETTISVATPTPAAVSPIKAVPFDMGESFLAQPWVAAEKLRNMPIRLTGLIAAPPTGKNLPIAVVIHGSHGTGCPSTDGMTERWPCPDKETPHHKGFADLLEALAAHGYVAVGINANPAYASAYGEPRFTKRLPILFDQYLAQLAAVTDGKNAIPGVDLKGRVTWDQLAVLGHSAGGEGVNSIIDSRADHTSPAQIAAGQGPIAAAILLAPSATSADGPEAAAPFAVILPACDRDVMGLDGQLYYEHARMKPQRDKLTASVYLPGANHNRFNSELTDETLGNASPICDGALLPAADQQKWLADYALHFFDMALGRSTGDAAIAGLDPKQPAPATLFGRAVLTSLSLPTAQRLRLSLDQAGAKAGVSAVLCKQGYMQPEDKTQACRRMQFNQPGYPEQLTLTWNGANGTFEVALPEGKQDASGYDMLHLRTALDPLSPLNKPGQPQSFSLRLTDGTGKTAAVRLAKEPALAFPAGNKIIDDSLKLERWDNHVILSSIRVPLSKFSGVDLSDVRSMALLFDVIDSGAILLADLELLRVQ